MTIGERLQRLRGSHTLRDIQTLSGISASTLSRMENGLNCELESLAKLAKAYEITIVEMLSGVDEFGVKIYQPLPFDEI